MAASLMKALIGNWDNYEVCPAYEDRKLRNNLSEKQVDEMVEDTFPASDPPSTY